MRRARHSIRCKGGVGGIPDAAKISAACGAISERKRRRFLSSRRLIRGPTAMAAGGALLRTIQSARRRLLRAAMYLTLKSVLAAGERRDANSVAGGDTAFAERLCGCD